MIRNDNTQGMAALAVETITEAIALVHAGDSTRAIEALCAARTIINSYVIAPLEKTTGEPAYKPGAK